MSYSLAPEYAEHFNVNSADEQIRPRERRSEGRLYTVLRVAKLVFDEEEHLCRIRNISARGIMAEAASPPGARQPVSVELRDGERLDGVVAWVSKHAFGITFAKRIDINRALAKGIGKGDQAARATRVKAHCKARIRTGALYHCAELEDISQKGCRLKIADPLPGGQELVAIIEGLAPIKGMVRWFRNGETGIEFNEALSYAVLESWLLMHRAGHDERIPAA